MFDPVFFVVWAFHRWGPQLDQATYKNRQRLYLSEQVGFSLSLAIISDTDLISLFVTFFSLLLVSPD